MSTNSKIDTVEFCFLCHNVSDDSSLINSCENKLEYNLQVIFLLRELLNISFDLCVKFLQKFGNPALWLHLCAKCQLLVSQGRKLFKKIKKLEKNLEHVRSTILLQLNVKKEPKDEDKLSLLVGASAEIREYCLDKALVNTEPEEPDTEEWIDLEEFEISPDVLLEEASSDVDLELEAEESDKEDYTPPKTTPRGRGRKSEKVGRPRGKSQKKVLSQQSDEEEIIPSSKLDPITRLRPPRKRFEKKEEKHLRKIIVLLTEKEKVEERNQRHIKRALRYVEEEQTEPEEVASSSSSKSDMLLGDTEDDFNWPFEIIPNENELDDNLSTKSSEKSAKKFKPNLEKLSGAPPIACDPLQTNSNYNDEELEVIVNIKRITCSAPTCSENFQTLGQMRKHFFSIHKPGFDCPKPLCSRFLTTIYSLENHLRRQHAPKSSLVCTGCNICFYEGADFRRHIKKSNSSKCSKAALKCSLCSVKEMSEESLSLHVQVHHEILGPLMCNLCGMNFESNEYLRTHKEDVHIAYPCRACDEIFNSTSSRKRHEKSHKDPLELDEDDLIIAN